MFQILVLSLNAIFNCQHLFKLISFHIISYHFISFHHFSTLVSSDVRSGEFLPIHRCCWSHWAFGVNSLKRWLSRRCWRRSCCRRGFRDLPMYLIFAFSTSFVFSWYFLQLAFIFHFHLERFDIPNSHRPYPHTHEEATLSTTSCLDDFLAPGVQCQTLHVFDLGTRQAGSCWSRCCDHTGKFSRVTCVLGMQR